MFVITLGSHGSGSTWIYNVVRSLFSEVALPFASASADHATEFLDNINGYPQNTVLKSHALDIRLLKLAALSSAKIIISRRDPRDSVVSQRQRFSLPIHESAGHVTRAFSSMAMIPSQLDRLEFDYEDGFPEKQETVAQIATFLGFNVAPEQISRVFDSLRRSAVQHQIREWVAKLPAGAPTHNPETQWHASHLGDGRVGKWREFLSDSQQSAIHLCSQPLRSPTRQNTIAFFWSSELFRYQDDELPAVTVELDFSGEEKLKVYGPYLYLPAGHWRVVPKIGVAPGSAPLRIKADTYLPNTGRETVAEASLVLEADAFNTDGMNFEVQDHFQPVEVRLMSVAGQVGKAYFSGVEVRRLA